MPDLERSELPDGSPPLPPNQVTAASEAPALASGEAAGEMVELYWMALLRDEPTYNENRGGFFQGFTLTRFDGTRITV